MKQVVKWTAEGAVKWLSGRSIQSTLEEQAEDLDEERELLDTDVEDVEAVKDLETLVVDETSEDLHDED